MYVHSPLGRLQIFSVSWGSAGGCSAWEGTLCGGWSSPGWVSAVGFTLSNMVGPKASRANAADEQLPAEASLVLQGKI